MREILALIVADGLQNDDRPQCPQPLAGRWGGELGQEQLDAEPHLQRWVFLEGFDQSRLEGIAALLQLPHRKVALFENVAVELGNPGRYLLGVERQRVQCCGKSGNVCFGSELKSQRAW